MAHRVHSYAIFWCWDDWPGRFFLSRNPFLILIRALYNHRHVN